MIAQDPAGTSGVSEPRAQRSVGAVVVNWNGGDTVARCVRSLIEHPPHIPMDVCIVDNASSDGSAARVRAEFPDVRVIVNPRNLGLAAGNNQGILASNASYVLISNPDVMYPDGAVDALVELLERRPRAGFAVARLRDPDGTLQIGAGDLPTLRDALVGRRFARRGPSRERAGFWWHGWSHDEEVPIGHGGEACYLVRRRAIDEVGLQDDRFVLDWEGVDWSARVRDAGWEIWFCPQAEVVHLGGVSLRQVKYRWVVSSHRGMYRYFRKRMPRAARPFVASAIATRAAAKLAVSAVDRRVYDRAH
ncbi:MAG TPA: glycosyltransferase family 2 protein [Acidimicrobiia bacterium]